MERTGTSVGVTLRQRDGGFHDLCQRRHDALLEMARHPMKTLRCKCSVVL
jgi:hypothetical protein